MFSICEDVVLQIPPIIYMHRVLSSYNISYTNALVNRLSCVNHDQKLQVFSREYDFNYRV